MGDRLLVIDVLTSYVRGFVASEVADVAAIREAGLSAKQWRADQAAYAAQIVRSGLYPRTTELLGSSAPAAKTQDSGFEAGLDVVLDGIATRLARTRRARSPR